MKEKREWSVEEIAKFERAWIYLEKKSPEINALCKEFNETNGRGLITTFWTRKLMWGTLFGVKLASGEKRAQRIIEDIYGTGGRIAVNVLTDEEANIIAALVTQIGNDFNLRVRREWAGPGRELTQLSYSIKPHFELFK